MESLLRWRQPVAVVLIVAVAVRLGLGVGLVLASPAAEALGPGVPDVVAVVLLTLLLAWCVQSRTSHARLLTALALVVCGLAVLAALASAVLALAAGSPILLAVDRVTALVVPALAVALLVKLLVVLRAPAPSAPPAVERASGEPPTPYGEPAGWQPEEAAGAAWHSAGAAASGAAASGWGGTDQPAGWDPVPWPDRPGAEQRPSFPPGGQRPGGSA
jgi:hypothetical protein